MNSNDVLTESKHVTIIEDYTQALSYVKTRSKHAHHVLDELVIALTPAAQSLLKNNEIMFRNSIQYFNNTGRSQALKKSAELDAWLTEHFAFTDGFGVSQAYFENLRWYFRWIINYLLWGIEIITEIVDSHKPEQLTVLALKHKDYKQPFMTGKEGCLSTIAQDVAVLRNVDFRQLYADRQLRDRKKTATLVKAIGRKVAQNRLTHTINLKTAKDIQKDQCSAPVLFTSDQYRLDSLAQEMRLQGGITPVLMSDWGDYHTIGWPFRIKNKYPFKSTICINFLSSVSRNHKKSKNNLEDTLSSLVNLISHENKLFTYKDIPFGSMLSHKLDEGITPDLIRLHQLCPILKLILSTMRPKLVVSNGCRLDDMITGELCTIHNIPSLMVSHGSHTPPSNSEEAYEWQSHARKLINAPYHKTALQSPMAGKFRDIFPEGGSGVKTGPLIWAKSKDVAESRYLKAKLLGQNNTCRVIVHAGTPKDHKILRFRVYETSDEYIQSIKDLSEAVSKLSDTKLLVMFRPCDEIKFKDLINLVPYNQTTIFTDSAPLDTVLGFTDLLVSYSSTVIEEALANDVPVLQYGAEGRYKHIDVASFGNDTDQNKITGPLYHINGPKDLEKYLSIILQQQTTASIGRSLSNPYIFSTDEICPITELLP